ncbi:MAG: PatA/PatG family cyanobactin maturation protease [Cyanobacteria bacterium P01_D01_bin.105]
MHSSLADFIGLKTLAAATQGDSKIRIAVLDGLVDTAHPCFAGAKLTRLPTLVQGEASARGQLSLHGTHVTSLIFGQPGSPIAGIAPCCEGVIVPIFSDQTGQLSQLDLARAINQAVEAGAHLINLSGGQLTQSGNVEFLLSQAVKSCQDNNVLIVAAAGNEGCDCLHVPAALPAVLAVGAMDAQGQPLGTTNWGKTYQTQGILAPGANILGAAPGGGVARLTGTSFATPIVTGVAALLLSLQRQRGHPLNPRVVREALLKSATPCNDLGQQSVPRCLAGRLNVTGAMTKLIEGESMSGGDSMSEVQPLATAAPAASLPAGIRVAVSSESEGMPDAPLTPAVAKGVAAAASPITVDAMARENMSAAEGVTAADCSCQNPTNPAYAGELPSEPEVTLATVNAAAELPPESVAPAISASAMQPVPPPAPAISQIPAVNPAVSQPPYSNSQPTNSDSRSMTQPASSTAVAPSQAEPRLVYALGTLGYDFASEARRDSFKQLMPGVDFDGVIVPANPYDARQMADYLGANLSESRSLIWTLNMELTPLYAIKAVGPFAREVYEVLQQMLAGQVAAEDNEGYVERVSIPGYLTGETVMLFSGQRVPVIMLDSPRGLYGWKVNTLVEAAVSAVQTAQEAEDDVPIRKSLESFLNRVYYDLRNLGQSSQERALNFAATNAFQAATTFGEAVVAGMELDDIQITKSPFCRMDSDCWDVVLRFFDAENIMRARKVFRFTIDVSDVIPVTLGDVRSWSAR